MNMKIILHCENKNYEKELDIFGLDFEIDIASFGMTYCYHDSYNMRLNYKIETSGAEIRFSSTIATVYFPNKEDDDKFAEWLVESDKIVREGFRTMWG